ncbi:hypothetical protein [Mesorhizobium sp. IMUNJ 23232]|uniref:hypothetical protein n=1 Tax=Mesorhizobium sp. IMUNJ 23232 TaxID=3376064 RepID=UPI00378D0194
MKSFALRSDRVSPSVTETGGHLSDVSFTLQDGRRVSPMHVAPWADEQLDASTPPIIRVLRGDFFCAPFGASDLIADMPFVHGLPASGIWRVTDERAGAIGMKLDGTVMGATVTKSVELRPGETIVYQRHTMTGGSGRIPVGHHAMLRAEHELQLAFSPWTLALTTQEPDETPPQGRPLLRNKQTIADLHRAERMDGGTVDLTRFPSPEGYEAIWMVVADRTPPFAWTAATCSEGGWMWFGLKNPRVLPQTLIWMSNGGRDYAPWNGRHRNAIGLEEICGYFHLGHAASVADNPVAASGSPTAITLMPDTPTVVSYMFGLAAVPPNFGAVREIVSVPGGVTLVDINGLMVFAACDPGFIAA